MISKKQHKQSRMRNVRANQQQHFHTYSSREEIKAMRAKQKEIGLMGNTPMFAALRKAFQRRMKGANT